MRILNFGSCNIDYVYSLDHIVRAGETETTNGMAIFPGGKGLNQSVALARAGAHVAHAGCIGRGGDFLRDLLAENGVDTSLLQAVDIQNGHAVIQVGSDGENAIFLFPGSNACVTRQQIDDTLAQFGAGDILLLQNELNELSYLIGCAHKAGLVVVLNPSPYNERIRAEDLEKLDYLILNEVEACAITGNESPEASLAYFEQRYPRLKIMLTLGKRGCIYAEAGRRIGHPIFRVTPVDTTAAGDTFTGYFVAGVARGEPIAAVLKTASHAAAITVSRPGAAPSIPTLAEVQASCLEPEAVVGNSRHEQLRASLNSYLSQHPASATVTELASLWGYTPAYTGQLVKRLTGKPFHALLCAHRVKRAAALLLEGDDSVEKIIHTVGYENQSFFRRAFLEAYGMNPLEYRKKMRGDYKA